MKKSEFMNRLNAKASDANERAHSGDTKVASQGNNDMEMLSLIAHSVAGFDPEDAEPVEPVPNATLSKT